MTEETEDEGSRSRRQAIGFLGSLPSLGDIFGWLFWGAILLFGGYFLLRAFPQIGQWLQENFPQAAQWLSSITNGAVLPEAFDQGVQALTPEAARAQFTEQHIPPEITNIVASDANWTAFRDLVRNAQPEREINGQRRRLISGAGDFTNEHTIRALLRDRPDMARQLLGVVMTQLRSAPAGTAPPAILGTILTSIKTVLNDPAALNELMDDRHRAGTLAILREACPVQFNEAAFNRFVETVGMSGGQVTPAFRAFIVATVDAATQDPATAATTVRNAFITLLSQPGMETHAAEIAALMRDARVTGADGQSVQPPIFQVMSNPQNVTATITLIRALEANQPGSAAGVIESLSNGQLQQALTQNPALRQALMTWRSQIDRNALPAEWQRMVDLIPLVADQRVMDAIAPILPTNAAQLIMMPTTQPAVDVLHFNPQQNQLTQLPMEDRLFLVMTNFGGMRDQLNQNRGLGHVGDALAAAARNGSISDPDARMAAEFLSTTARRPDGSTYYVNLAAANTLMTTLGQNPANQGVENALRTRNVSYAIYRLAMGDNSVFNTLPPEDIAAFFADAGNRDAVGTFLRTIDTSRLSAPYQRVLRILKDHWNNPTDMGHVAWWMGFSQEGISWTLAYPGVIARIQGREQEWRNNDWFTLDDDLQAWVQQGAFRDLDAAMRALPRRNRPPAPAATDATVIPAGVRYDGPAGPGPVAPTPDYSASTTAGPPARSDETRATP